MEKKITLKNVNCLGKLHIDTQYQMCYYLIMKLYIKLIIVTITALLIFCYAGYSNYYYDQDLTTNTKRDILLELSACARARDLAKSGQWSHENFEKYLWFKSGKIGENLARFGDMDNKHEAIWNAWLNSPLHKKNIDEFNYVGYCTVDNITVGFYSDK